MIKLIKTLIFLVVLAACTPEYTVQSIDGFSKRVGVVDYFEISRWHHYLMAQDSRIVISAQAQSPDYAAQLADAIEAAFSQYYADVTVLQPVKSGQHVVEQARVQGYDFLLRAELLSAQPEHSSDNKDQVFKQLKIMITVLDVNSGAVVDKILLLANKSRIPFVKGAFASLLHEPLDAVAEELSGVQ